MIHNNNIQENNCKKEDITFVPLKRAYVPSNTNNNTSAPIAKKEILNNTIEKDVKKDEKVKSMIQKFNNITETSINDPEKKELKQKTLVPTKPKENFEKEKTDLLKRRTEIPEKKEKPELPPKPKEKIENLPKPIKIIEKEKVNNVEKKEIAKSFEKEKPEIPKKEIAKSFEKRESLLNEIKETHSKSTIKPLKVEEKIDQSPKLDKKIEFPEKKPDPVTISPEPPKSQRKSLGDKVKEFINDIISKPKEEDYKNTSIILAKETPTTPTASPIPDNIVRGPIPKKRKEFTDDLEVNCLDTLLYAKKAGFLLKLGARVKNMKKRFCVLVDHRLFYFYDEKAKEAKGIINLSIPNMAEMYDREKFKFTVTTPSRVYYLTAENEQSADAWILAINQNVKYQKDEVEIYQRLDEDKKNLKILNRDYDGYEVNFFSVFTVPEMKKGFYAHLEKELNTEPFDFLLDMESMKNEINKESIEKFNEICDTYIKTDAKKSLNIPGQERAKVLRHLRTSSKLNWISDESPVEVLDPIRRTIVLDMRGEPFPRFIQSDQGYEIVSKNYFNPQVISQNPLELVLYKIKNSFYGDTVDEDEIREYAANLSNKGRLKKSYLATNWLETVKLSEMIKKTFSREKLEKLDEHLLGISEKSLNGTIKVKIVIIDKPRLNIKKQGLFNFFYPLSSKLSTSTDLEDNEEFCHTCLMIGPWILSWDESELCIPKKCISNAALIVADLDSICVIRNLEEKIDKLADCISLWNTNKKYHPHGSNFGEEYGNSQDFVEHLMKSLGIKDKLPQILEDFLKVMKTKGGSDMTFTLLPDFQKKFSIYKKQITFKTHTQLDEFVLKLYKMDSDFDKNWKEENYLLKSFDRAFWIKYINLQTEILKIKEEKKKSTLEKLDRNFEKLDKEIKLKNEELVPCKPLQKIEEDCHCCPFDDPLKTQSLIM